jgi:hypothetical protein
MAKKNNKIDRDSRIQYPVRLLSMDAACHYLSCSSDTLEELISLEGIPVVRLSSEPKGNRDRRKRWIDVHDLDSLIERKKEGVNI